VTRTVPGTAEHIQPCVDCGVPTAPHKYARDYDVRIRMGQGRCNRCYKAFRKREPAPPAPVTLVAVLLPPLGDQSWRRRAICADLPEENKDLFYPFDGDVEGHKKAIAMCGNCPVRRDCLTDALANHDVKYGIRGGLSPNARRALHRRLRGKVA
jgi:WhiB family redox-sensing transcriptional regulator